MSLDIDIEEYKNKSTIIVLKTEMDSNGLQFKSEMGNSGHFGRNERKLTAILSRKTKFTFFFRRSILTLQVSKTFQNAQRVSIRNFTY